jgi:hypothetical protein
MVKLPLNLRSWRRNSMRGAMKFGLFFELSVPRPLVRSRIAPFRVSISLPAVRFVQDPALLAVGGTRKLDST